MLFSARRFRGISATAATGPPTMNPSNPLGTVRSNVRISRQEREMREHLLEHIEGDGAPQQIVLNRPVLVFGRAEDADVRVASQRASRHHATLTRTGTDFVLADNDSRNGVFLNGVR